MENVLKHCQSLNNGLTDPMSYNEVKGIAKSISRYCWKKDAYCYQEFIDRQTRKGKLGGRPKTITIDGNPWDKLGISRATFYRKYRETKA